MGEHPEIPSERTIDTWLAEFAALPAERRADYERVRWPVSFGTTGLPWESAGVVLREMPTIVPHWSITVRRAMWFWRVTCANPALSAHSRVLAALTLDYVELTNDDDVGDADYYGAIEALLAGRMSEKEFRKMPTPGWDAPLIHQQLVALSFMKGQRGWPASRYTPDGETTISMVVFQEKAAAQEEGEYLNGRRN
ncbi:MAG: hypothetical protein AB7T37_13915 [Dehalococcoidia bacterium]